MEPTEGIDLFNRPAGLIPGGQISITSPSRAMPYGGNSGPIGYRYRRRIRMESRSLSPVKRFLPVAFDTTAEVEDRLVHQNGCRLRPDDFDGLSLRWTPSLERGSPLRTILAWWPLRGNGRFPCRVVNYLTTLVPGRAADLGRRLSAQVRHGVPFVPEVI